MRKVRAVQAIAGLGLQGDCNANAASPRQVLLVSRHALQQNQLRDADLRANLVVDGDVGGFESGTVLLFSEVKLRLTIPCEPCSKLERVRAGLLRAIGPNRGTLARVVSGGCLRVGDPGKLACAVGPKLSPSWKARAQHIINEIPPGSVITYAMLATLVGIQSSYCRAFPRFLQALSENGLPAHRVIPSDVGKLSGDHRVRLLSEGVIAPEIKDAYWEGALYYLAQEHLLSDAPVSSPRVRAPEALQSSRTGGSSKLNF
jgi:alkylated DNA nucleotide flippase Atl1